MAEKSCDLRREGKAYPRTCQVCGLGPCISPDPKPQASTRSDWTITLGAFSMTWKEPLTEADIDDIEKLTGLALTGMRRRLTPTPTV